MFVRGLNSIRSVHADDGVQYCFLDVVREPRIVFVFCSSPESVAYHFRGRQYDRVVRPTCGGFD